MVLASLRRLISRRDHPLGAVMLEPTSCDGYVEELSAVHAQGWIRDIAHPGRRVDYTVLLPASGEIVAAGCADQFGHGLATAGIGDGIHAFWTRLQRPLSDPERRSAVVRLAGGQQLPFVPNAKTVFEPLLHVSMDIVDNCNLRCPFCLYDYEHTRTTHFMAGETLDAALRFLPYTRDGEFWFSCLHEPTLHPQLIEFIDRIPAKYRRKLFYTSNLAKRMPAEYFDWLAGNGMHHVNISIESRERAVYERMRKGARYPIFLENWDLLMAALDRAATPTPIRYVTMAYKSNLRALPSLARYLLEQRHGSQVEIRYTFEVPWIPADFRASEFLDDADWDWLQAELAGYAPEQVNLLRPARQAASLQASEAPPPADAVPVAPSSAAQPPLPLLPGRAMFRLSWDGALKVVAIAAASRNDVVIESTVMQTNIRDLAEPAVFFRQLSAEFGI